MLQCTSCKIDDQSGNNLVMALIPTEAQYLDDHIFIYLLFIYNQLTLCLHSLLNTIKCIIMISKLGVFFNKLAWILISEDTMYLNYY